VRKLIALAIAVAASLVVAAVAFAAVTTTFKVTASPSKASTKKKERAIALGVDIGITDPTLDQPPPLKKVVIRFNSGGKFNGAKFPKCSFAKLQAKGIKGCPKGSKVGTGKATASAKPIIDLVNAKMTIFNGQPKGGKPTVLLYNIPDISSPITLQGTLEKKSASSCADGKGKCDYTLTFEVPDLPTLPNAPPASVLTVKTKTGGNLFVKKKKGRKKVKIPYIGAPKKCNGTWVAEATINYKDGQTSQVASTASCKK
jgi:hypothetical protein